MCANVREILVRMLVVFKLLWLWLGWVIRCLFMFDCAWNNGFLGLYFFLVVAKLSGWCVCVFAFLVQLLEFKMRNELETASQCFWLSLGVCGCVYWFFYCKLVLDERLYMVLQAYIVNWHFESTVSHLKVTGKVFAV